MPQHTVFLSHAHADNDLCDPFAEKLSKWGIDVWYDRTNMDPASLIPETIANELQKRTALIVMLTPHAVRSKWVMKFEVGTFITFWAKAGEEERIVLPIMLTDCEVPPILQSFKRIDAALLGQDETLSSIAKSLGIEPPLLRELSRRTAPRFTLPSVPVVSYSGTAFGDLDDEFPYDWDYDLEQSRIPQLTSESGSEVERYLNDWIAFVREKWIAINDSQLGLKPLRGRWTGWDQIYGDTFNGARLDLPDRSTRRFNLSQAKGSGASAVACFLRDLDTLRALMGDTKTTDQDDTLPNDLSNTDIATKCDHCGSVSTPSKYCPDCGAPKVKASASRTE